MDTKKHNVFVMTAEHYFFAVFADAMSGFQLRLIFPAVPASCFLPLTTTLTSQKFRLRRLSNSEDVIGNK